MTEDKDHITPEALRIMRRFPELFGPGPWTTRKTSLGWGFSCGEGWYPIIERLCTDLAEIVRQDRLTTFRVSQVKEKLGSLRFYVRGGNDRTRARILEAEHEAATTCERCGRRPAQTHDIDGLLMTCCVACREVVAQALRS